MKNFISHSIKRLNKYIIVHKVISTVAAIVLILSGYGATKIFGGGAETQYVLGRAEKGAIISSVTGSGQVSASNEISLKSKVGGDIVYLGAVSGDRVKTGDLLIKIDDKNALLSLESAKIALEKLTNPDPLTLIQRKNALIVAEDALVRSYDDGFSAVSSTFVNLPDIMTGLKDLFSSQSGYLSYLNAGNLSDTARSYKDRAGISYAAAQNKYDTTIVRYNSVTRRSSTTSVLVLITDTYDTVKILAEALKDAASAVGFIKDQQSSQNQSAALNAQSNLNSWTSRVNAQLLNLLSIKNTIENAKNTLLESKQSLSDAEAGARPLDIQAQRLAVEQQQNNYDQYFIRASFAGRVQIDVKNNESVGSGAVLGTLITEQKMATVSLNEIDVAPVKIGQKATLTFDAISGLSITGVVTEIDLVGTINQGVVTYNVKIAFDTQDNTVKSGMSVSTAIITNVKQDILVVPNSAVKTRGNSHYVEIFDQKSPPVVPGQTITSKTPPRQQRVEVGVSNDTSTEIISGLNEGEVIVTRTVTSAAQKTSSAPSFFGTGGGRGGGAVRIPGR